MPEVDVQTGEPEMVERDRIARKREKFARPLAQLRVSDALIRGVASRRIGERNRAISRASAEGSAAPRAMSIDVAPVSRMDS